MLPFVHQANGQLLGGHLEDAPGVPQATIPRTTSGCNRWSALLVPPRAIHWSVSCNAVPDRHSRDAELAQHYKKPSARTAKFAPDRNAAVRPLCARSATKSCVGAGDVPAPRLAGRARRSWCSEVISFVAECRRVSPLLPLETATRNAEQLLVPRTRDPACATQRPCRRPLLASRTRSGNTVHTGIAALPVVDHRIEEVALPRFPVHHDASQSNLLCAADFTA